METVREKLVDEIEGLDWYHVNQKGVLVHGASSDDEAYWKCNDVMNAIYKVMGQVPISEWVSVDEPPKESGHYWVNIHQEDEEKGEECDFVLDAWYQPNDLLFAPKEVGWTLMNEWHDLTGQMRQYITHWMPVPYSEPPKGVQ